MASTRNSIYDSAGLDHDEANLAMDAFGSAIDLLTNTYNDEIQQLIDDVGEFLNLNGSTAELIGLGLCADPTTFLVNIDFGGGDGETTEPPDVTEPPPTDTTTPFPTPTTPFPPTTTEPPTAPGSPGKSKSFKHFV